MRRITSIIVAMAAGLVVAGCVVAEKSADVTNAPVGEGADVTPGSPEDFIVNVGRRIYFTENSDDLDDTARATLDKQAEFAKKWTRYKLKVEGFADEKGTAEYNMKLGMRRAEAARDYLAAKGVPANRMRVKSLGNTRKVNDCPDASCTSQNRRVITVLEGDMSS